MDETIFASVYLGDARLAAHASSATAVWLWSADGARILWANPAGCAALGAKTPQALLERTFAIADPARTHIERLADTLPVGGGARLFRLRGFAGAAWSSLTCSCARFDLGRTPGILVMATESVGADVALAERVRRLGFPEQAAVAAYAQDGAMLFATPAAERRLAGAPGLDAVGAASLATAALATGSAHGDTRIGPVVVQRIGRGASTVLLAGFPDPVAAAPSPAPGATKPASDAVPQPAKPAAPERKGNPALRRHPLRFVWQMDAAGRFSLGSEEFAGIIGTPAEIVSGRPWSEINAELGLDPEGRVAQAIASRETWSNITISWPIGGSHERLEVELAGLPAFDRSRDFLGYRGFGVCRDIAHMERLAIARQLATAAKETESAPPQRSREPVAPDSMPPPEAISSLEAPAPAPIAPNVVRFPGAGPFADLRAANPDFPGLSAGEHSAFHELARQLTVRLQTGDPAPEELRPPIPENLSGAAPTGRLSPAAQIPARAAAWMFDDAKPVFAADDHPLLNRLPVGILVYRYEEILFANRAFLAWTGYPDLQALRMAGGLDALFLDAGVGALADSGEGGKRLAVATRDGDKVPFEGRLFAIHWDGESAFAVLLFKTVAHEQIRAAEAALGQAEALAQELGMLLDRAADAILVVDRVGVIVSSHGGGTAFLGRGGRALAGAAFESLFAPDARNAAAGHLARVVREGGTVSAELTALAGNGELRRMIVTIARIGRDSEPSGSGPSGSERLSVVLRDISVVKRADALAPVPTKAAAQEIAQEIAQSTAKDTARALAKLCHDARSPINSILGFCDVMLAERFGPLGTDRYREYIRDISASGTQVMSLLADTAELAEIVAGTARLSPVRVSLNEIVNACVTGQQAAANEARVVVRTALSPGLQPVFADAEAVRSMIVNLLLHALRTTRPGGQVIVSTGRSAAGDVVLRIRDSGEGLNERAIEAALQASPLPASDPWDASTWDAGGQTSGLALTRALAEANHAQFTITSKPQQGSLFEVTFTAKPQSVAPALDRRAARDGTVTKPVDGSG